MTRFNSVYAGKGSKRGPKGSFTLSALFSPSLLLYKTRAKRTTLFPFQFSPFSLKKQGVPQKETPQVSRSTKTICAMYQTS